MSHVVSGGRRLRTVDSRHQYLRLLVAQSRPHSWRSRLAAHLSRGRPGRRTLATYAVRLRYGHDPRLAASAAAAASTADRRQCAPDTRRNSSAQVPAISKMIHQSSHILYI